MFKFNDDNIFTGYIKQLLASFNLPKYRIYTTKQQAYHDDYVKNEQRYKELYNGIIAEIEELTYAIHQETIPAEERAAMKKRIKELEKQKIKVPHTPELNVFISSPRHTASTYTNSDAYQSQVAAEVEALKTTISKLEDEILEDSLKPDDDPTKWPEDKRLAKEQELAEAKEFLIEKESEIESVEFYPTYMRYIPYIKNNEIQIYAPKIGADGKIEYSSND